MRKIAAAALAAMMAVSVLTGCGSQTKETAAKAEETKPESAGNVEAAGTASTTFPEKNIKIIVPFDAGGGVDITCRVISEAAGKDYFNGHSIIVENMPGGGAIVGQTNVANAKADGYTMLAASAALVTNPIFNETTYKTSDFKAIAMVCFDPQCVVVPKDSPYNTLEEFVEAAKQDSLKMSTPGQSTSPHLAGVQMEQELGVKFDYLHTDSANMQLQQMAASFAQQGVAMEQYLQMTGKSMDSLKDELKPVAQKQVKLEAVLDEIIRVENITVSDEEMDEQYELISQKYGQPVDVVKQVIPKAQLKPDLLRMKASQLIIDAAEIIMEESGK